MPHNRRIRETSPTWPRRCPCVVVAGGREPPHWEAYPQHQFLHTVGALPCCAAGGCWKSRCQPAGDGDARDRLDLCEHPVQLTEYLRIGRCMDSDYRRRCRPPHRAVPGGRDACRQSPSARGRLTGPGVRGAGRHASLDGMAERPGEDDCRPSVTNVVPIRIKM